MVGFGNLSGSAISSAHADSPSPDRPSQWRAGRNSNNGDEAEIHVDCRKDNAGI